jgi:hypothetical protein
MKIHKYKLVRNQRGKFHLKLKTWFWYTNTLGNAEFDSYNECISFLKMLYPNKNSYDIEYDERDIIS